MTVALQFPPIHRFIRPPNSEYRAVWRSIADLYRRLEANVRKRRYPARKQSEPEHVRGELDGGSGPALAKLGGSDYQNSTSSLSGKSKGRQERRSTVLK